MLTQDALNFASQQFHIYFGLSILILGVIGGILNIIIFTTLKTFRETTCAFYLTAVSVINIGQLLIPLSIRVLSEGFLINITETSWVCKIQVYLATCCTLVSTTGMCLAAIDQCLSMSTYRRFSNLRLAQRAVLLNFSFWGLYNICILLYWSAPFGICTIINTSFSIYMTRFHLPVLLGFLPISIMMTFSLLAFYNARTLISRQVNIVRLSRDRQLTVMTLVHVIFVIITTLPDIIFVIYSLNQTSKDPEQIARNNLIYTITILIDYSSFAVSVLFFLDKKKKKSSFFIQF
jgi:hypothetical protein